MNQLRNVVVIGAGIGGLTTIAKVAEGWPANLQAVVLVALATPDQPAEMVLQILENYAAVGVRYAQAGQIAQSGRIYLSPPGQHLIVSPGGFLELDPRRAFDGTCPSADRLFSSAAAVYGERVIGIILSGDSKEGAQGLRDIESAGGVGIVQQPEEAIEPRMPRYAIAGDHPTYCVKAADIAALVQKLMISVGA